MFAHVRPALAMMLVMSLITGVAYPLVVAGIGQAAFASQANGSLIHDSTGQVIGSTLIAQPFTGSEWFHPRPSAGDFATVSSSASNLAASNPALVKRISGSLGKEQGSGPEPLALVMTSGSGLDPHLPPDAARYQIAQIAHARGMPAAELEKLVDEHTERSLIGPSVVNVLQLNLALNEHTP
ncbi:potassium-transporting ATPase KdpC subunit [Pseudomonas asuensis]|uniref:Potassium-transporting ATPase KdpC subunit n=1 Tax=Pseudomonas asuensis TaxID=1825787 RepID=A0ABQ2GUM5_9PSED|nr:potassium-transporting ATPase subunit KdpC [Pseudomonas asuensis]GGM14107.1 potassium-transporting ATPase KdpC subunit [Pseudomonas asuensis]